MGASASGLVVGPRDPREGRWQRPALLYLLRAAAAMAVFYAILYFPYPAGSLPVRAQSWYLRQVAAASGAAIRLFDATAQARGDTVDGRFSLRIVLDCAALDAHALLAAAVLAFPASWAQRAAGVLAGTLVVALANILRIAILYVVGVRWPASFAVLHEDVLQLAIILTTFLVFGGWIAWTRRPRVA
jgi:exosortase/archaeosortase family protein